MGHLLRGGVLFAASVVMIGGAFYLFRYGATSPDYHVFHGEPADLRSVSGILKDVVTLRVRGIIQFGVLLLMATPVARVLFAVYGFFRQDDRAFVAVSMLVLALLLLGLMGIGFE